jgi:NADP-dependent 3-hydroxy acid dehydrogenase YdfG
MRMDLNPFGIRVGAIHPGMVQTEFSEVRFKGDTDRAEKYIKGSCPYNQKISPTSFTFVSRPYHINIADLVVMSTAQASSTIIKKRILYIATINCTVFT